MCVKILFLMFSPELLRIDQVSPTLELVNDYFRFVIGFFEVISISAPHVYRSALPLSPRESILHKLHKPYIQPLVRVVRGLPISWEPSVTTVRHSDVVEEAAWSSCSRFIAIATCGTIEILDATTLERLHTFTHPSSGNTRWLSFSPDSCSLTQFTSYAGHITWDLQTGGQISVIPPPPNPSLLDYFSSAYSVDGKVAAVAYRDPYYPNIEFISTYNVLSRTLIYSHRVSEGQIVAPLWTHGDFLRFVTVKPGSITIWEAAFTSEHTFTEIESLPAPDDDINPRYCLFLPTRTRLAYILDKKAVLVWDARDSKILLKSWANRQPCGLSFSSDGHFFAYRATSQEIHLWEESPTGYVLHRKLTSDIGAPLKLLLSPNGKSITAFAYSETRLWYTTDPITSLAIVATWGNFILEFSPDRSLAAVARVGKNTATIIDLKSGDPRLVIDTGMGICGLGVTANTVIVVGDKKIITWDLPAGDSVLGAEANIQESVRTTVFNHPASSSGRSYIYRASISPNFNYFVTTWEPGDESTDVYDLSTGKHLVGTTSESASEQWFTQDGREVWSSRDMPMEGWKIVKSGKSDIIGLEPLGPNAKPSGGYLWESSHGHDVADDGWILDSRKKRVMWLPHRWRVRKELRIWGGRFLGLLGHELPEPVILELDE